MNNRQRIAIILVICVWLLLTVSFFIIVNQKVREKPLQNNKSEQYESVWSNTPNCINIEGCDKYLCASDEYLATWGGDKMAELELIKYKVCMESK